MWFIPFLSLLLSPSVPPSMLQCSWKFPPPSVCLLPFLSFSYFLVLSLIFSFSIISVSLFEVFQTQLNWLVLWGEPNDEARQNLLTGLVLRLHTQVQQQHLSLFHFLSLSKSHSFSLSLSLYHFFCLSSSSFWKLLFSPLSVPSSSSLASPFSLPPSLSLSLFLSLIPFFHHFLGRSVSFSFSFSFSLSSLLLFLTFSLSCSLSLSHFFFSFLSQSLFSPSASLLRFLLLFPRLSFSLYFFLSVSLFLSRSLRSGENKHTIRQLLEIILDLPFGFPINNIISL